MLSVLEVTQRVPPTCITKTSRTLLGPANTHSFPATTGPTKNQKLKLTSRLDHTRPCIDTLY
jgi:hypothetical protein